MNGHHPPIETDPLGAIRKELLSAAWRQKARRDRNRRVATVTASFVLLLASVAGGASALGVDLPWIGEALNRHAERELNQRPDGGQPTTGVLGEPADIAPGAGNATDSVEIPWTSASTAVGAAYLNTRGQACVVFAAPGDNEVTVGGCADAASVEKRIDEGVASIESVAIFDRAVVAGYVSDDAEVVEVKGPDGPLDTSVSGPWKPTGPDGSGLRVFFATADLPSSGGAVDPEAAVRAADRSRYEIEVRLRDGRTVSVRP